VIPCIRCNMCTLRGGGHGQPVRCTVNPLSVREDYYRWLPPVAAVKKKVVVVGGGPAGLEAALLASSRGHDVTLFEKEDRLGGNLLRSSGPAFKDDWKSFLRYLLRRLEKSAVNVRLGTEATAALVAAEAPDAVVIAAGAEPVWPDLPGSRGPNVVWAGEVMQGCQLAGEKVVVAGTGGMGMEAALHLAQQGKKVEIVELPGGSEADPTANFINVIVLRDYLENFDVKVCSDLVLERVLYGKVAVRGAAGEEQTLLAEAVVLAPPLLSRRALVDRCSGLAEEVHVVGDCRAPRVLFDAIHEGFEAALSV
jgi:thioredoxin reductase